MRRTVETNRIHPAARRYCAGRRRRARGFTLTEVVVASALLITAIVPILKALTGVHLHAAQIEHKTRCLNIAQTTLEEIKARSIYSYNVSYAESNRSVDGVYLRSVSDTPVTADLRRVVVSVGCDTNGNGTLAAAETLVTLRTLIARRW